MSALAFTDQTERLRNTLRNALEGATYESSRPEEDGRHFVLLMRRADGRRIGLRFRGVSSTSLPSIEAGATLRLGSVGGDGLAILGRLIPTLHRPAFSESRVRIEAGAARIEVVCQDAEWWEEAATEGQ
ncbi:MAG TPA: hypothetical protein VI759_09440 [Dehalococcoidia bacterium]|nr:hypothetical protein [Dehalococcoidia bacterium]